MSGDIDQPWQKVVGKFIHVEKTMPDEYWTLAATQEFAKVVAVLEGRATTEEMAVLIGAGAMLVRLGRDETMAGIRAALAIRGVKPVRR